MKLPMVSGLYPELRDVKLESLLRTYPDGRLPPAMTVNEKADRHQLIQSR